MSKCYQVWWYEPDSTESGVDEQIFLSKSDAAKRLKQFREEHSAELPGTTSGERFYPYEYYVKELNLNK